VPNDANNKQKGVSQLTEPCIAPGAMLAAECRAEDGAENGTGFVKNKGKCWVLE